MSCITENAWALCMKRFLCMNSVSGLCLSRRDTALKLNLPFELCRWLVEGEDLEGVHELLVRHRRILTSMPLLRP